MSSTKVHIVATDKIPSTICDFVADRSKSAIAERGAFYIGVSGGSAAKLLCQGLPAIQGVQWDKWHVYFCDERLVPFDNPESTYTIYKEGLIGKTSLPLEQIYAIKPELSVEDAAKDYADKVSKVPTGDGRDKPTFDLLVLGMGPDGHTCSLFPGHKLLQETSVLVAPISDSPKPPPCRVTLTYPVINAARSAMFVSAGAGKADMLQRVLEGKEEPSLPAARVKLHNGELHWFIDQPAAGKLQAKY
ncbi:6-phosphogluconolactonase-like [Amphiura filiformis]|uniref:6-phosphogluconolactonase-like n=1 Tax=Amphiura filiformis TaxID=82378 RepID=UPI003B21EA6F